MHGTTTASPPVPTPLLDVARRLAIALQLGLLIVLIYQFDLVNASFQNLCILTFFGFLVHASLPRQMRLHCFLALSLAGIVLVLGVESLWLLALGLVLIGICHLPLPYWGRLALLAAAGAALAVLRAGDADLPWSSALWPILASMFMFRVIIYLYDLQSEKTHPGAIWTLSYFFMLPNVCFPLFPVVDFKRFRHNYYNEDAGQIYQRGIDWMFRGCYHLLLYRLIYHYGVIAPGEVSSTVDLLRYMVSAFLLYLRISGMFHLIVGMLLLFGFNLPETHHRYYFASSFTDFWRRINIYWKDFMMKIFYYPVYFRLKRFGPDVALVISTLVVFFLTWALHAYQWFWLRGTALLEAHDALFWGILGVLVVINSLWEAKRGRARTLRRDRPSNRQLAARAAQTIATFTVICILWSLWSADSLLQWLLLWQAAGPSSALIVAVVPSAYLASWLLLRAPARATAAPPPARNEPPAFWNTAAAHAVAIGVVALIGLPAIHGRLSVSVADALETIRGDSLNARDTAMMRRGYYEQLVSINEQNDALWEVYNRKPKDWALDAPVEKEFEFGRYGPNAQVVEKGALLRTNRWGMRDKDYTKEKPPGVFRVAFLGSSHVMGAGVTNEEEYEQIVDERINEELGGEDAIRYESLNFSGGGRSAIRHLDTLETMVVEFQPDVVIHVTHRQDELMLLNELSRTVRAGREVPFEFVSAILRDEGIEESTPDAVIQRRLQRHVRPIIRWAEARMVEVCLSNGITPLWVFQPMIGERLDEETDLAELITDAEAAGFTVISLAHAYDGHDVQELQLASWDDHPNALGHRLVAEALYQALRERADLIGLPTAVATSH